MSDLTYAPVGATRGGALPNGYRHLFHRTPLGDLYRTRLGDFYRTPLGDFDRTPRGDGPEIFRRAGEAVAYARRCGRVRTRLGTVNS